MGLGVRRNTEPGALISKSANVTALTGHMNFNTKGRHDTPSEEPSDDESDEESLRTRLDRARIKSLLASKDESDDESDESDNSSDSSDDSSSETVEHQRRLRQADANMADKEAKYKRWIDGNKAKKKAAAGEAAVQERDAKK
jgi:hypothetical protein